jgi:hypothetical protein
MHRHSATLREVTGQCGEDLSEADVDDAVSDLWLSLLENDMQRLRAFDPSRGVALLPWLSIRVSQVVFDRDIRRRAEPQMVSARAAEVRVTPEKEAAVR